MRTNSRKEKMTRVLSIRCTEGDLAVLRVQAQSMGLDTSTMIRQLLIREKLLRPMGDYELGFN